VVDYRAGFLLNPKVAEDADKAKLIGLSSLDLP
jgi:hypothetical protein